MFEERIYLKFLFRRKNIDLLIYLYSNLLSNYYKLDFMIIVKSVYFSDCYR